MYYLGSMMQSILGYLKSDTPGIIIMSLLLIFLSIKIILSNFESTHIKTINLCLNIILLPLIIGFLMILCVNLI